MGKGRGVSGFKQIPSGAVDCGWTAECRGQKSSHRLMRSAAASLADTLDASQEAQARGRQVSGEWDTLSSQQPEREGREGTSGLTERARIHGKTFQGERHLIVPILQLGRQRLKNIMAS